ncbi:NAD(P)/FAD-dependent oxidoreductase [Sulfolobus acidocaldarius]|uniref:Ferredoxin--NADP reductase 2 n=4 Tax=Sulfolobus acidocaldarius TaxID=2285 RepID=FENR2_SULAC|nr:NAD(P)/FAD-dependent oxidoreductase [Sulfolobus acidocaldarius]Q4J6Z4.1 RecName: Full=Ferredoxin--NADP reductase 2; Short=FNR 2; Short=Fd-NADP(+) reductase 2 [Sulfolobus acidocaldarius DSM 639]AAY81437.1 thioredoxin reductase [Sulfolobus acidocaldarius DSM 639]AGE72037.1 ferredoxin--NADP reductase [Sulfolobus acidocaldarius N8]AGE74354.1 ferredoxin--NADP reductase [Sulfolobus acidocaldarius Ron12/I]ALU29774.1 ferredoxin--NADP(+) reductase [Sulfolobus acidocaldarius]ALU32512.1 ferredoxin--N
MKEYDIIIVGGGPIGLFATFYSGLRDMSALLIDAQDELGGQLVTIYPEKMVYDVGGYPGILAYDLAQNLIEQAKMFSPDIRLKEWVDWITRTQDNLWVIKTDKGNEFKAKTILLALGIGRITPSRLGAGGEIEYENRGVYYTVKRKKDFEEKRILIVGGGDSAVDWAINLAPVAKSITLIHRRDQFRAHESSVKQLYNIASVHTWHELKEVKGDGSKVTQAVIFDNRTKEEKTLDVDAVIISIGHKGDLGNVPRWGLNMKGRDILVNAKMETNLPGVYAAGDIASQEGVPKMALIAIGFSEAAIATSMAKKYIDPNVSIFGGHSSEIMKSRS